MLQVLGDLQMPGQSLEMVHAVPHHATVYHNKLAGQPQDHLVFHQNLMQACWRRPHFIPWPIVDSCIFHTQACMNTSWHEHCMACTSAWRV